jgi:hypothetical protein
LLSRAVELVPGDSAEQSRLRPRLVEARFELGELRQIHMSRASFQCFWRWPFGHRWGIGQSRGASVFRCADCGKRRRRAHRAGKVVPTGGHIDTHSFGSGSGGPA